MKSSFVVVAAALLLAAGAGWLMRGQEPVAGWLAALKSQVDARPAGTSADKPAAPRKCLQGNRTVYTDGACPAGSREQAVSSDRVTVVPATPVPRLPAAAASLPNARDILGRPDDGTLREQRMERQIDPK